MKPRSSLSTSPAHSSSVAPRTLVIRMSSLGDVILAMSVLSSLAPGTRVEWLTSAPYAGLFEGHPGVSRLWIYDKKSGASGWRKLWAEIALASGDQVLDLQGSLRTWRARLAAPAGVLWSEPSKERFRRSGYFLLKRFWPRRLRPRRILDLHQEQASALSAWDSAQWKRASRVSLEHLTLQSKGAHPSSEVRSRPAVVVMPASLWPAKQWAVSRFLRFFAQTGWEAWVAGTERDAESRQLLQALHAAGLPHRSLVGTASFSALADEFRNADAFLGGDTGLAHFADALGLPSWILYGPTTPDVGFGSWSPSSVALGREDLWCRPCGKDGRFCHRLGRKRFSCLSELSTDQVLSLLARRVGLLGASSGESVSIGVRIYRFWIGLFLKGILRKGPKRLSRAPLQNFLARSVNSSWSAHGWRLPEILWFHAASAGEMEILYPVLLEAGKRGAFVIATVFSGSDPRVLGRLADSWKGAGLPEGRLLAAFSPLEGAWEESLRLACPDWLVTAKYEAWPDLWASASAQGVPIVVVGAKPRRSLDWAFGVCRWLGQKLPRLEFHAGTSRDFDALTQAYGAQPQVSIHLSGDPRWERVRDRSVAGNPRAQTLVAAFKELPRPWGVLGSVWGEDLSVWMQSFPKASAVPGTLWVVPHQVGTSQILQMESALRRWGATWVRSSRLQGGDSQWDAAPRVVLVDEIGFLSELYASADWAFVGGGFGKKGVHSTIEPALQGIPVAIGPSRAEAFSEIPELRDLGQLSVVKSPDELWSWVSTQVATDEENRRKARQRWQGGLVERFGATGRILDTLRK